MSTHLEVDTRAISTRVLQSATVPGTGTTIVIYVYRNTGKHNVTVYRHGSHVGSWGRDTEQKARECANDAWRYEVQLRDRPRF